MAEHEGFLEDTDYYDDFGFMEPDCIQKSTQWCPTFMRDYLAEGSAQQRKIKCGLVSCIAVIAVIVIIILAAAVIALIVGISGSSSSDNSDSGDTQATHQITIPSRWSSSIRELIIFNGVLVGNITGVMEADNVSRNSKVVYSTEGEYGSPYDHQKTEYLNSQNMWLVDNGICRGYPQQYNNIFSFLPKSSYEGQVEAFDQELDVYYVSEPVNNGATAEFWLLADGNTPVVLNITVTSSTYKLEEKIHFVDFQEASFPQGLFDTPSKCLGSGEVCSEGPIDTMDMILYSPSNDISLSNKNTGDINGAAGLICDATIGDSLRTVDYITLYKVQVNTTWGRYGICYQSYCNGGNSFTVGRAAAFRVKDMEGQCTDNSDTGNWYSLQAGAQCEGTNEIGDNNCAWKLVSLETTISAECLLNQGFADACVSDPELPFNSAAQVLQSALNQCENVAGAKSLRYHEKQDSSLPTPLFLRGLNLVQ